MTVGIVGLGLIGGSLGLAFRDKGHVVLGQDANRVIQDFAKLAGGTEGDLTDDNLPECEVVFLALPSGAASKWLEEKAALISKNTIVIDCCGTKRQICREGFDLSKTYGFKFVGGHPMAGKQYGGYKNSAKDLFDEALFALVPSEDNGDKGDVRLLMTIQGLLKDAGFAKFSVLSPEEHDQIIAFTSQMAHLISNAYIKSPMAEVSIGTVLSGGAFRDMTRVAYLDENLWTELFMENKDNLLSELEGFIEELEKYKEALESEDASDLTKLLAEGKRRKAELDGSAKEQARGCDACGDE